jgi:hypothetical protein
MSGLCWLFGDQPDVRLSSELWKVSGLRVRGVIFLSSNPSCFFHFVRLSNHFHCDIVLFYPCWTDFLKLLFQQTLVSFYATSAIFLSRRHFFK